MCELTNILPGHKDASFFAIHDSKFDLCLTFAKVGRNIFWLCEFGFSISCRKRKKGVKIWMGNESIEAMNFFVSILNTRDNF